MPKNVPNPWTTPEELQALRDKYSVGDWPYPLIDQLWEHGDEAWTEVDYEVYRDQGEVLCPADVAPGAFACGEPYHWDQERDVPVHSCFVQINDRYFGRIIALDLFNPTQFREEIRKQFDIKTDYTDTIRHYVNRAANLIDPEDTADVFYWVTAFIEGVCDDDEDKITKLLDKLNNDFI